MKVEEYYEELDTVMVGLREAYNKKDFKKIASHTKSLNALWEKGKKVRMESPTQDDVSSTKS
jgi:hypothetical protein